MPLKLVFQAVAHRDLADILSYIAQASDVPTAQGFIVRLRKRCEAVAAVPGMGTLYPRRANVRKINEGPYKIFYHVINSTVIILRIWDGRRGTDPSLKS